MVKGRPNLITPSWGIHDGRRATLRSQPSRGASGALALKTDIRLVEAGRNSLMRKFGVNNSMELVRLALRYGILNV